MANKGALVGVCLKYGIFAGKLVSFLIPNLGNFPAYSASLSKLLLFSFIIGGGGGKWERKMVCIRKRVKVCVCV